MQLLGIALFAQLAVPAHQVTPVLAFPEPGVDDTASYHGYQTRFFKDAAGNTVQLYLDRREGRVVNLWADAEDESIGFTVRTGNGSPAPLRWADDGAAIARSGRTRTVEYEITADAPRITIAWFLLGSMRVERDFQYFRGQHVPLATFGLTVPELERLAATIEQLPSAERTRALATLGARDVAALRARLRPSIVATRTATRWRARVRQPTLDGRDTISVEISADPRRIAAARSGDSISLAARSGGTVPFTVRIATTGKALTPLTREEIFNAEFLHFLADAKSSARTAADSLRARRLERQVRGVELLSSHEKLMAGLPTYATYFGRDMLMSALMMRPVWREEMSEFAIASALRKLGPHGDVSHEEALGGQAVREGAAEYVALVTAWRAARAAKQTAADSLLARSRAILRELRRTRENYHMIDDEFQLAVLAGRWLGDSTVRASRKRAFLLDTTDFGEPRLARLVRELGLVTRLTAAYAKDPVAANLVSFARRDSTWGSASWRDSGVGYAGGRYAMDINAIWAPHALDAIGGILDQLRAVGLAPDSLARALPDLATGEPLGTYARDRARLAAALETWRGAAHHFVVTLAPAEVSSRVAARIAAMPAAERDYWTRSLAATHADSGSLAFLAIALDGEGHPIGVANSDPATQLFLGDVPAPAGTRSAADARAATLRDARIFVRPYPVGLMIGAVGPVVANDAYAPPAVWEAFVKDPYHGPRVVWGREINLFLLGAARRASEGDPALAGELRAAIDSVRRAVAASRFHSELWSYEVVDGKVVPARYGTSADVQLWSTTDLAVEFALSRLQR